MGTGDWDARGASAWKVVRGRRWEGRGTEEEAVGQAVGR